MKELHSIRKEIDAINTELLSLLAKRFSLTRKIGELKHVHGLPPKDTKREAAQLEKIVTQAKKLKLETNLITKIFQLIVEEVVKEHKKNTHP
ncbi:MAG: chorismate mutase [Candidatus Magasanikbacteria bacterium]|nr:chorismate mutase [Candidatus Magasanikbacteria bacterium]|tara:strand:+ start:341 stop:616 length:276 start_codon:yes stop_codon:yes gene_type:complete